MMSGAERPPLLRLALAIVAVAARLVPRPHRDEWQREWCAELWHLHGTLEVEPGGIARHRVAFLLRSTGSIVDALQLRVGDTQTWSESVVMVVARWGRHTPATALALLLLSIGIAADALLIVFTRMLLGAPRDGNALASELRSPMLAIAAVFGVALLLTSVAAARRLLDSAEPRQHGPASAAIVEGCLTAAVTGWVGWWFATFGLHAIPHPSLSQLEVSRFAHQMTRAWMVSWFCGLALLGGLTVRHARRDARRRALRRPG